MTGSYRSLGLDELNTAFSHLGAASAFLRPVAALPEDADPANAPAYVYQAAVGPVEVSTDTRLVPMSAQPIWDVNGYYRAVGIGWPYRPTRAELRRAYQARDGQADDYATYAFKRLLDAEFRAHYDRRPLGQPVDDLYRWQDLRRLAAEWAKKQSQHTGMVVTVDDLFGADVIERMQEAARAEEAAQTKREMLGDDGREDDHQPQDLPFVWPFAYYLWGSRKYDDETLAQWQEMLVHAFAEQGLSVQMAVGYFGRASGSAARMQHPKPGGGYVEILFLHEHETPSTELAHVVVGTYYTHPYRHRLEHPIHLHLPR